MRQQAVLEDLNMLLVLQEEEQSLAELLAALHNQDGMPAPVPPQHLSCSLPRLEHVLAETQPGLDSFRKPTTIAQGPIIKRRSHLTWAKLWLWSNQSQRPGVRAACMVHKLD